MFNQNHLLEFLSRFDPQKRAKMLDAYILSLTNHIEICNQSVAQKNAGQLQASAHDLKSIMLTLGLEDIGKHAESIETLLKTGDETQAFSLTPPLIESASNILKTMQQADRENL